MTTRNLSDEYVVELFAGPGGMSEGLAMAGIPHDNMIGVELDPLASATAEAAGHRRITDDVCKLVPSEVAARLAGRVTGFHASPPCQGLSMAGKGKGREDLERLLDCIAKIRDGWDVDRRIEHLWKFATDERSPLTLEPLRWIKELEPEWITLEQVPAALPIWEAYASVLEAWGYSVWTGFVHAEQYGVPQTRKRAILRASRVVDVTAPTATHSKYHNRTPERRDEGVLSWVSMAEALGWGMVQRPAYTFPAGGVRASHSGHEWGGASVRAAMLEHLESGDAARWTPRTEEVVGFPRKYDGRGEAITLDGVEYRARDLRSTTAPAQTVTEKARSWSRFRADVVAEVSPRVNNQSGTEFDLAWPADRPAPTVAGREIVTMPGANANRFNGRTKSRNDGIRVTPMEAAMLQSFDPAYPWQGSKTKQYQQIGNSVPPLLGAAMVADLLACASAAMVA